METTAIKRYLNSYSETATLAFFRLAFGLMMLLSILRFAAFGWIKKFYIDPAFHFTYYGFGWVKPIGDWTYLLFAVCGLSAFFVAIGYKYKPSAIAFFLSFTYIELMDKTTYLNHYYFISVIGFVLIFLPANAYFSVDAKRNPESAFQRIPRWNTDILKILLAIVYLYAGIAKINSDWLIEAMPLKIWLPNNANLPVIGPLFNQEWVIYAFAWIGMVYDLSIVFLLLDKRTRGFAFVLVVIFHVLTKILFPIGVFPYVMIVSSLLFFSADFHKKCLSIVARWFRISMSVFENGKEKIIRSASAYRLKLTVLSVFLLFQLLFPFRYLCYPDELFWTEEGFRFSWRVMLMEKAGYTELTVVDSKTGAKTHVDNHRFLTAFQEKQMAFQPDFILEYAHFLHDRYQNTGFSDPKVYAESYVALNGRLNQLYINPTTDLAHERESFAHKHGYSILKMTSKVFNTIALLFAIGGFAQSKISGTITATTGEKVANVEIYDKNNGQKTHSNADGSFIFESSQDHCDLVFYKEGFGISEASFSSSASNVVVLLQKINNLSEVVIRNQREKLEAIHKLKDVEGTAIYAGRKTEVISLDRITANKATNNARQVFAQVVGLTINESPDGGLQLSIGSRGLDPNRTSNFNTRQNGYDISADVLGYPESYYATPTEALEEIQIVRGAASLQYGTQFGGLVNFITKKPVAKPFELTVRNTVGSYGLFSNFTSVSGTPGKFSYYSYFNYKQADGFRANSDFESKNYFANLNYQFTAKTALHFDYTYFHYLAHQAGGLTDKMFYDDITQSNRTRNWFAVDWNLFALRFDHKFAEKSEFSLQLFGLDASRKTVGFRPNRVSMDDIPGTERDLIVGDFVNWGAEARFIQGYDLIGQKSTFLIGAKYYQSDNKGLQGPGSSGSDANFNLATSEFPFYQNQSNYAFPNVNVAFFVENIFKLSSKFSVTPGIRFEQIRTKADGYYRKINRNLAGNVILDETIPENNTKDRHFVLAGVGLSFKPMSGIEWYGNGAMNYRSVTFNDIRTAVPNQEIDPNITDEKGYTSDIGVRGSVSDKLNFDASVFGLYYDGKIGDLHTVGSGGAPGRIRKNIGTALTYGFEALVDWKINKQFFARNENFQWNLFTNLALTDSQYLQSDEANIEGNSVEFVPLCNLKSGMGIGYKNLVASVQFTYLSDQFTDADNTTVDRDDNTTGISGKIPAYHVADVSASYTWKNFKLEAGVTNFTNEKYFTRRATGYPGPGIIPSDLRSFYTTLEFKF